MEDYLQRIGFSLSDIKFMTREDHTLKNEIHGYYRSAVYYDLSLEPSTCK